MFNKLTFLKHCQCNCLLATLRASLELVTCLGKKLYHPLEHRGCYHNQPIFLQELILVGIHFPLTFFLLNPRHFNPFPSPRTAVILFPAKVGFTSYCQGNILLRFSHLWKVKTSVGLCLLLKWAHSVYFKSSLISGVQRNFPKLIYYRANDLASI